MFSKPFVPYIIFPFLFFATSCNSSGSREKYSSSDMYDFAHPNVVKLPQELDEISGIAYYAKDSSVFAIIDEGGDIFKISLKNPKKFRKWKFDKKKDYEDLVLKDSTFYVLVSDGDIEKLTFKNNEFSNENYKIGNLSLKPAEFESLYDSEDSALLVLLCKDCTEDSKKTLTSYSFNEADSTSVFKKLTVYDLSALNQKLGIEKRLHPSAAAINPITKELYLVSSIQKLLVIFDRDGDFKSFYKLNPKLYKQPEGMTFTPAGDLIIANEFAEDGFATLLLLKNKMNKK